MPRLLVLFVCDGNIVRSPVCEHFFYQEIISRGNKDSISAKSAGLQGGVPGTSNPQHQNITNYANEWELLKDVFEKEKIPIKERWMLVNEKLIKKASVIIYVGDKVDYLGKFYAQYPNAKKKIYLATEIVPESPYAIYDVYGLKDKKKAEETIKGLKYLCKNGYERIISIARVGEI